MNRTIARKKSLKRKRKKPRRDNLNKRNYFDYHGGAPFR